MSLFDDFEHIVNIFGPPATTEDAGGGDRVTWPTARAMGVPCLIQTTGSHEQLLFAQQGIVVTHVLAFSGDAMAIDRGDKITALDTQTDFHVNGVRVQRGVGGIDTWTLVFAQEQIDG